MVTKRGSRRNTNFQLLYNIFMQFRNAVGFPLRAPNEPSWPVLNNQTEICRFVAGSHFHLTQFTVINYGRIKVNFINGAPYTVFFARHFPCLGKLLLCIIEEWLFKICKIWILMKGTFILKWIFFLSSCFPIWFARCRTGLTESSRFVFHFLLSALLLSAGRSEVVASSIEKLSFFAFTVLPMTL